MIRGTDGERVVSMQEFNRGPYRTAVRGAEMLTEIRIPLPATSGSAYEKLDRRAGDWAVAAAGVSITLAPNGKISEAGIALAAVGGERTCTDAEQALKGKALTASDLDRAADAAANATTPISDQRGSAQYKRHVAGVLTRRALQRVRPGARDATGATYATYATSTTEGGGRVMKCTW